jgi:hypothetical protein
MERPAVDSLYYEILGIFNSSRDSALGKILTVIDAVIPAGQQNKATKDSIKSQYYEEWNNFDTKFWELMYESGVEIKLTKPLRKEPDSLPSNI